MIRIDYKNNKQIIEYFYNKLALADEFEKDNIYLESSFNEINDIWIENLNKIDEVKYLLIAEAPLWGENKKYIYNPKTNNSQFFYRSDLEGVLNIQIKDKSEFIKVCNDIGLLVIDISPFPLNTKDTKINYGKNKNGSIKLTKNEYKELVSLTISTFFEKKINLIQQKKASQIKVFFRYARVQSAFQDLIYSLLIENGFIEKKENFDNISQRGGGIDRMKLKNIIKKL